MPTYKVHMLAFMDGRQVRPVTIPEPPEHFPADTLLVDIFYWGQNDFCPDEQLRKSYCSVSMGDVIELHDGRKYLIKAVGFEEMSPAKFEEYLATPKRDRVFKFLGQ